MIDYNDCNDNSRYRGRRQSSLSSNSVCPYASDSYCDDDDDYNDDGQYIFWDGYNMQDENVDLGDDDDSRYNHNRILLQQQLSLTNPSSSSSPPRADNFTDINKKRFVSTLINSGLIQVSTILCHVKLKIVQLIGNMLPSSCSSCNFFISYTNQNMKQHCGNQLNVGGRQN